MAEPKTRPHDGSVDAFLDAVAHEGRRQDARAVLDLMRDATGLKPEMWGPSIVGFGRCRLVYANGSDAEWPKVGFSPRKQSLTLYLMRGFERYDDLMGRLGKHKTSKACLYINRLSDVDLAVLRELVVESMEHADKTYP